MSTSTAKRIAKAGLKRLKKRKLKVRWSAEMEQQLQCLYNISADSVVAEALTRYG